MAEKQPEFVISDRRRFSDEGELRPNASTTEEEKPATPPPAKQAPPSQAAPPPANTAAQNPVAPPEAEQEHEEMPEPPSAQEVHQQHEAYKASGKKIDEIIAATGKTQQGPMTLTFEDVIESLSMSAAIQLGLYPPGSESRRVDIIGARQTIDSLEILQEKTKGNLTDN